MAGQKMNASGSRSDLPQAMLDLAQGNEGATGNALGAEATAVELTLSELVGDANGEVVIFNDSGLRTLALHAQVAVVEKGQVAKHVTAAGEDVSGYNCIKFDNGVTLYFPDDLDLILMGGPPASSS